MKKTVLLYIILFFSTFVSAQDACTELTEFNKKNIKRAHRITSTMEQMGQKTVHEVGKDGESHMTMNMDFMGQKQKVETILVGSEMYMKKNDDDWVKQPMDAAQIALIKKQGTNSQMQFYKNCKKLDNKVMEGKTFRVYSADFDPEKMKEMMGKSSENQQAAEMMSKMEMKMTVYINEKDDIEKATMSMSMMGQSFDTDMVYEYDVPINVCAPTLPKEGKN
jgi:hypothetical protein